MPRSAITLSRKKCLILWRQSLKSVLMFWFYLSSPTKWPFRWRQRNCDAAETLRHVIVPIMTTEEIARCVGISSRFGVNIYRFHLTWMYSREGISLSIPLIRIHAKRLCILVTCHPRLGGVASPKEGWRGSSKMQSRLVVFDEVVYLIFCNTPVSVVC